MAAILDGAEPFILSGGRRGVLLVHGFTGTPAEMFLLGKYLNKQGYTVLAPRLCGHGTNYAEMATTDWVNWYHSVCDGYYLLKSICEEIDVVGLSMGGILSLKLAMENKLNKVVTLSTPIHIANRGVDLLPPIEECAGKYVPKKRRKFSDVAQQYCISYDRTPIACVHHLLSVIKLVSEQLGQLKNRLLVVQSTNDHTVIPDSANFIYDNAGSEKKELLWLEESGHLVTLDLEREKVFEKIVNFLKEK
ncbi:MAG: Carboxylesterase [Firmicutes bacterium]|nr:Carboxylesterase [Bacillota bacterium]